MLVPLLVITPPPIAADVMPPPGAKTSRRSSSLFENEDIVPSEYSVDPTDIISGKAEGQLIP